MNESTYRKTFLVFTVAVLGAGAAGFALAAQALSIGVLVAGGLAAFLALVLFGCCAMSRMLAPAKNILVFVENAGNGHVSSDPPCSDTGLLGKLDKSVRNTVCELQRQNHWLRGVLDAIPASVSVTDLDMNWTFCNKSALDSMQKSSLQEVLGKHCSGKKGNLCDTPRCGIIQLRQGVKEVVNQLPSGNIVKVQLDFIPDADGKPVGHLEFGVDVTAVMKQEHEAKLLARSGRLDTCGELAGVVEQLNSVSSTLLEQVSTTKGRIDEVSGRIGETATAMEEMYSTVQEVAKNASSAATAAGTVVSHTEEGSSLMGRTVEDMGRVQEHSVLIKQEMERLAEQSRAIGGVLTLISDIADQTNLLALNAAIEAARAGDAGRGFAVVADEVRKLAEKTMNATREVESAVEAIQISANNSLTTVNNAVEAINAVVALAGETDKVLSQIKALSDTAGAVVHAIATAAEQQRTATDEINRNISEVNSLAGDAASDMGQAAEDVEVLSQCSVGIVKVLDEIKDKVRQEEEEDAQQAKLTA